MMGARRPDVCRRRRAGRPVVGALVLPRPAQLTCCRSGVRVRTSAAFIARSPRLRRRTLLSRRSSGERRCSWGSSCRTVGLLWGATTGGLPASSLLGAIFLVAGPRARSRRPAELPIGVVRASSLAFLRLACGWGAVRFAACTQPRAGGAGARALRTRCGGSDLDATPRPRGQCTVVSARTAPGKSTCSASAARCADAAPCASRDRAARWDRRELARAVRRRAQAGRSPSRERAQLVAMGDIPTSRGRREGDADRDHVAHAMRAKRLRRARRPRLRDA